MHVVGNIEVECTLKKKKILFIPMTYTMGGGSESLLTTIVNHLDSEKYDISIMEILHSDIKVEPSNPNIHILPYIMRADDPERKHKMYYVYHEPEKVFQKFVKDDYDLYVSFNYQRPIFLLPPGKKNIAWIHADIYDLAAEDKKEELQLEDDALDNVKHIVGISDITMQSIRDLHPRHVAKLVEINNGIDIERVRRNAGEPADVHLEHPALLFIGRLEEGKDPVRVVNVLALVHQKHQIQAHAYFLGYGNLADAVQERAKACGLSDYVHLLGYHDNPFPIMKQCDVVTFFSKSEGFPMCLLESQALGKPIVSTVIGGSRILIRHPDCGEVIETDEAAAEAVVRLLKTDRSRIKAACEASIQRFALDKYIAKIEKLFDATMAE